MRIKIEGLMYICIMDLQKVGENIKTMRMLRGYSQEGLARKVGKSQNWQQQLEKGEIDVSLNNLILIGRELDVTLEHLLTFSPNSVFNNCIQSGTFNNCVINSEQLFNKGDF